MDRRSVTKSRVSIIINAIWWLAQELELFDSGLQVASPEAQFSCSVEEKMLQISHQDRKGKNKNKKPTENPDFEEGQVRSVWASRESRPAWYGEGHPAAFHRTCKTVPETSPPRLCACRTWG